MLANAKSNLGKFNRVYSSIFMEEKKVNNKELTFPRPMTAVLSGTTAKEVAGVNKIATTVILKETNTESG